MAVTERPYDEPYFCTFLGQKVHVDGLITTISGRGPTVTTRQMAGCNGRRLCGKFPQPAMMEKPESVGCPYHDALNRK